jgi:hypothetical protein
MKLLRVMCTMTLGMSPAHASPLATCAEFLPLEPFHLAQIRVVPATGHILYGANAGTVELARYMAVFGWMQGQIEADVWFANGRNRQAGLDDMKVEVEGTTYDHMTWAFTYCRDNPEARMPVVVEEVFNYFVRK